MIGLGILQIRWTCRHAKPTEFVVICRSGLSPGKSQWSGLSTRHQSRGISNTRALDIPFYRTSAVTALGLSEMRSASIFGNSTIVLALAFWMVTRTGRLFGFSRVRIMYRRAVAAAARLKSKTSRTSWHRGAEYHLSTLPVTVKTTAFRGSFFFAISTFDNSVHSLRPPD